MKKRIIRGVIVGAVIFVLTAIFHSLHFFHLLEWKSWDLRMRLLPSSPQASRDIVVFLIDQESLDVYEEQQNLSWPWPRQMYSAVISYCIQAGVRALVFDLTFSESSLYGVEDDEDFARAIAGAGNVFLPVFLSREREEEEFVLQLAQFSIEEKTIPPEAVFPVRSASLPLENLLNAARGVGNVQFAPDEDGIFRRLPLYFRYKNLILASLPGAVARFIREEEKALLPPLDSSGRMIIRYYGPTGTYKSYSIAAIINSYAQVVEGRSPQIPPQELAGKIVFVGASAPGLYDLRPSPLSSVYPGVEIMATVLDNLLHEDFIRPVSDAAVLLIVLILALLTGLGTTWLPKIWQIVLFVFFCLTLPAALAALTYLSGIWMEFAAPEFAVLLSFISASVLNYQIEGKRRKFIKNVFRHYLSPHVIERIIENPDLLRLGGEKREITSFFSDVAGFTSISEKLTPEDLVTLLNEYLSEMTEIILCSGGTLDKYEGDAIVAFWNAPLEQPDHALRACRAALECQRCLEELRPRFQEHYGHGLWMRIGINTGAAVVGNMGSRERFDYTAMGDTVNLASRLEGACKQFDVPILIGEETFRMVRDHLVTREVDLIRVVGRRQPVRIFQILGEKGTMEEAELERIDRFGKAVSFYRKGEWEKALRLFQGMEDDMLARLYVSRCQKLLESGSREEWSGVYELDEK